MTSRPGLHQLLCELDTVGGTDNGNDALHAARFRVVDGNITGRLSPRLRRRRSHHWVGLGSKVNIPDLLQLASSWSKNGISILGSGRGGEGGGEVGRVEKVEEDGREEQEKIRKVQFLKQLLKCQEQHHYTKTGRQTICVPHLGW